MAKIKLKEALKRHEEYGDFDVLSNGNCWVAYCGTELTEEGEKHYAEVLEYDCEFTFGSMAGPVVLTVECFTLEQDAKLEEMLMDMAGYCSEKHYERCFVE